MVSLIVVIILTFQLFLILQWTKEDGHRTSTSAVPNLFVPLNTNPKEVQEMRNKVCIDCHQHSVETCVWEKVASGWTGCSLLQGQRVLALAEDFCSHYCCS